MGVLQRVRSSLVLRTTLLVFGVALGIGFLANAIVGRLAWRFETDRAKARVEGLLSVIEPSASAACFVGDHRLAEETAKGLLNSPSIATVEIRGSEGPLTNLHHPNRSLAGEVVVRPVFSPFAPDQWVGEVRVTTDANETARSVGRVVWVLRALILVLVTLVALALAWTVLRTVVRPIKQISDRLNGLDAAEGMRLTFPAGHHLDEIGRLVEDVNLALGAVEERHRLEQQVQQAHAQKINSLGNLAGGVAHDFNNMLAGIMAYAELLLANEQDPKRQKYLQSILGAAQRSADLTRKLLAFGRRGKNQVRSVDLAEAVRECLQIIKPTLHPDLQVITRLGQGLLIDGDPTQVHQVLLNLCINAHEAMSGGGTLTIEAETVELVRSKAQMSRLAPGTYVELRVSDTGAGISREALSKVFEPFFTTKIREGQTGTGLGLSTVYGIVEAHHGSIDVESTLDQGSTFRVRFPEGQLALEATHPGLAPSRGEGVVLVVEDEPTLREVAREALGSLGYTVVTAENGQAGVEVFRAQHDRLRAVLMDLKMPIMGGREAFHHMRDINPSVPVIICTGYGENEEVQGLLSQGARGMLAKPYQLKDLARVLERVGAVAHAPQ